MACRDYEFDFEIWQGRGREHLARMTDLARQLVQAFAKQSAALPSLATDWWAETRAGVEVPFTKESFHATARMLCGACQAAETQSLRMPPAVAAWWVEHKQRDASVEDLERNLAQGLSPTPTFADFWDQLARHQKIDVQVTGIPHRDAVRGLVKAGWRVVRQGKATVMTDGTSQFMIPHRDPVNGYAMAALLERAGLTEEAFRKLL